MNWTTTRGEGSALCAAASYGRTEIVALLLDAGADPTLSGAPLRGQPLTLAVEANAVEIVTLLLKKPNVDVNGRRSKRKLTLPYVIAYVNSKDATTTGTFLAFNRLTTLSRRSDFRGFDRKRERILGCRRRSRQRKT